VKPFLSTLAKTKVIIGQRSAQKAQYQELHLKKKKKKRKEKWRAFWLLSF
jgi:hypothetical protein